MNIILLGAPGAGKGTQASRISEKYNLPHISTGDIFRDNIKRGTEIGLLAKAYTDKGQLVPDEVTCKIVEGRLKEDDCKNGYVLDGFPRTIPQAEALDKMVKIDKVIDLEVSDEAIIARMSGRRVCEKCGATYHLLYKKPKAEGVCDICGGTLIQRKDDHPDTVKARLEVYHKETEPLIAHYKKQGVVKRVDGQEEVADTTRLTLAALEA